MVSIKKQYIFLFAFMFFSCSKDNETDPKTSDADLIKLELKAETAIHSTDIIGTNIVLKEKLLYGTEIITN